MVIFKRKTQPKGNFPAGVVVRNQPKGWMDESGVLLWINKVWGNRPGGLWKERSLLVWDAFRAHLTDLPKTVLREDHNADIAVIPGGLSSIVQPLDVCLNKPFKDHFRSKWSEWMLEGEKT